MQLIVCLAHSQVTQRWHVSNYILIGHMFSNGGQGQIPGQFVYAERMELVV